MSELLLDGAIDAASAIGLRPVAIRARFARHLAAGHRLRSCHCFEPAYERFTLARKLAADHAALPEWEPIYAAGIVRAHSLSNQGMADEAVSVIDETIALVLEHEIDADRANQVLHHLKGRKLEIEASICRTDDVTTRVDRLVEARAHNDSIAFDRSTERIDRKLEMARRTASSDVRPSSRDSGPTGSVGDAAESDTEPASAGPAGSNGYARWKRRHWGSDTPRSRVDQPVQDEDTLESIDYPDTPVEFDDESDDPSDPYMF